MSLCGAAARRERKWKTKGRKKRQEKCAKKCEKESDLLIFLFFLLLRFSLSLAHSYVSVFEKGNKLARCLCSLSRAVIYAFCTSFNQLADTISSSWCQYGVKLYHFDYISTVRRGFETSLHCPGDGKFIYFFEKFPHKLNSLKLPIKNDKSFISSASSLDAHTHNKLLFWIIAVASQLKCPHSWCIAMMFANESCEALTSILPLLISINFIGCA